MRYFAKRGYTGEDLAKRMCAFLFSPTFEEIDIVRITAALWAGIARKVSLREAKVRASDYNDVELIAHYAPYCDAMLVDRRMKDLLTTNPIKDKLALRTKFFTAANIDELVELVEFAIRDIPVSVAKVVPEVYSQ